MMVSGTDRFLNPQPFHNAGEGVVMVSGTQWGETHVGVRHRTADFPRLRYQKTDSALVAIRLVIVIINVVC